MQIFWIHSKGRSQPGRVLFAFMGWDSVAAAQLSWPRNQEGHNESGQQTGDENNHDNDVADCWQEIDELHSDSEGELSQNTSGSDRGNRVWWASLLLEHSDALELQRPQRVAPVRMVSCCTGAFAEGTVMEDQAVTLFCECHILHNADVCESKNIIHTGVVK